MPATDHTEVPVTLQAALHSLLKGFALSSATFDDVILALMDSFMIGRNSSSSDGAAAQQSGLTSEPDQLMQQLSNWVYEPGEQHLKGCRALTGGCLKHAEEETPACVVSCWAAPALVKRITLPRQATASGLSAMTCRLPRRHGQQGQWQR